MVFLFVEFCFSLRENEDSQRIIDKVQFNIVVVIHCGKTPQK